VSDLFEDLFSDEGDLVIGTYMSPPRLFDDHPWVPGGPARATEVVAEVPTPAGRVLITRMSGLFVSPPADLHGWWSEDQARLPKKLDYEQRVAAAFNMIT
jgi:hypothetical protein